ASTALASTAKASTAKEQDMAEFDLDQERPGLGSRYRQHTGSEARRGDVPFAPIPPAAKSRPFRRRKPSRLAQTAGGARPESGNGTAGVQQMQSQMTFAPRISVLENESEWACEIDVPGVERSDLHVQVQLNKLLVTGLRRDGANGLKPVHVETTNGRFDRILPL